MLVLYPYKNALWALRPAKPLGVLSRHPCRNPKPLPRGEGLCMLSWLCICAIVVVYCRCVLHRLCSTTCMRPCIKPLGVLSRHPCRIPKPLSPVKGCICLVGFASLQSPLAYTPGIHAGAERGATALTPLGATPKARTLWLLAKSFARCKTNKASNARHPIFNIYKRFFDRLTPPLMAEGFLSYKLAYFQI